MTYDRRWLGLIAPVSAVGGAALAKGHVIGANPQTFFGLGFLAAISIGGIIFGLWSVLRKRELMP